MKIDAELYRAAFKHYAEWNKTKMLDRAYLASKLTPQELWRQYAGLWEFCMRLAPEQTELQQKRRAAELELYYQRIQKFEEWRRAHGKRT